MPFYTYCNSIFTGIAHRLAIWGRAVDDTHEPMPSSGPSFKEWEQMLSRTNQLNDGTMSPITVITDMSPTSVISYLGDHRHLTKNDLEDMMASLQLLFEAQQAGRNITEQKAWVDSQELWELLNVECVGGWDEGTLQLLREEHHATADQRKRERGPEEEPLARPLKRVKRM